MKTRHKVMESVQELASKKVVHVDNEIQVLVGNLPSDFEENEIWHSSVERLPNSSGWLENGQHLVLVGNRGVPFSCTPTKWETKPASTARTVRLLKENLTPSKSRKTPPLKCSLNVCSSPSKIGSKFLPAETLSDQSSIISQQITPTRLKSETYAEDAIVTLNGKLSGKSKSSSVRHIVSDSWQSSHQAKYVDSTTDVPSPTEGAVAPDTGRSSPSSCASPDSIMSLKCSNGKSTLRSNTAQKKCDGETRKRFSESNRVSKKKKQSREMRQLYVSLKEIPWAQHWSPRTFLGATKQQCRASRKILSAQLEMSKRPSSIYAKFYPPKKEVKSPSKNRGIDSVGSKKKDEKDAPILKKDVRRPLQAVIDKPTKKEKDSLVVSTVVRAEAVVLAAESVPVPKPKTLQISGKKLVKPKDGEKKLVVKKASKSTSKASVESIQRNYAMKVKGAKVTDLEVQRTKSLAERFDFVAKPKKPQSLVEHKPIVENAAMSRPSCIFVKKEVDGNVDKPKINKPVDASLMKGKCENSQKCCQEGNCHADSMAILDSLFQQREGRKRKFEEEEMLRSSVRQSECAFRYKEIAVKKHHNYIQIILVPNSVRRNTLSLEALRELKEALLSAQKDPTCKVVLLNSSGKYFCSGLDLSPLLGPDKDKSATVLAETLKSLVETLALFSKPLVAGVNGKASGFGVGLLPFCDVVLASDKATFHMPYAKLGYIPEAAATLTLPQVLGSTWATNMLLRCQKLTAIQAHNCGLVTEVLWPSKFMEEVVPRVQQMASQSLQVMEATKVMLRCHQWEKLQAVLQTESRLLSKQWLTPQCQKAVREMLT